MPMRGQPSYFYRFHSNQNILKLGTQISEIQAVFFILTKRRIESRIVFEFAFG